MSVNGRQNCFIILKDHKPNFQNNPTVRLLNKAKKNSVELVKPSSTKINVNPRNSLHINHWKNRQEAINWFKGIGSKLLPKQ